jgi:hypothetical protein
MIHRWGYTPSRSRCSPVGLADVRQSRRSSLRRRDMRVVGIKR